jgi:hypothetical protein
VLFITLNPSNLTQCRAFACRSLLPSTAVLFACLFRKELRVLQQRYLVLLTSAICSTSLSPRKIATVVESVVPQATATATIGCQATATGSRAAAAGSRAAATRSRATAAGSRAAATRSPPPPLAAAPLSSSSWRCHRRLTTNVKPTGRLTSADRLIA